MPNFFETYDALLLDLDGTVWKGGEPIETAVETINEAYDEGLGIMYVTNNASNAPSVVAQKLAAMGLDASAADVMTSAQAAIELAREVFPAGTKVLILGTDSFRDLARDAGFEVVFSADDKPEVVLHGHNPETGWAQLSEAALAIAAGARYFASNLDTTLPQERGKMVGNGSMVQAVVTATGVVPQSAGKPQPPMFYSAKEKLASIKPLAVGDRLDTDIAGGNAAGMDTFHVLTGVSGFYALLAAPVEQRPTFIAKNMDSLHKDCDSQRPQAQAGFQAHREGNEIILDGGDKPCPYAAIRTVLSVAWQEEDSSHFTVKAQSEYAQQAINKWW